MNDETLTDERLEATFREMLTRDSDKEFAILHRELNVRGITDKRLYDILLDIWRSMNVEEHDKELDLLANWLEDTSR